MGRSCVIELVRPAFGMSTLNIKAIMKRATIMISTTTHLIVKFAKCSDIRVHEIPVGWGSEDAIYLKIGIPQLLEDYSIRLTERVGLDAMIAGEQRMLRSVVDVGAPGMQKDSSQEPPTFQIGGASSSEALAPAPRGMAMDDPDADLIDETP